MTLKESTYFTAICDLCGAAEDGEYSAWSSPDGADYSADESEWYVEGGNHICYDCQPRGLDLLDDDEIDPGHGAAGHACNAAAVSA